MNIEKNIYTKPTLTLLNVAETKGDPATKANGNGEITSRYNPGNPS